MYVCTYVYCYVYIYTYIHTYIYTYKYCLIKQILHTKLVHVPAVRRCFSKASASLKWRTKIIFVKFTNVLKTVSFTHGPGSLPHCDCKQKTEQNEYVHYYCNKKLVPQQLQYPQQSIYI